MKSNISSLSLNEVLILWILRVLAVVSGLVSAIIFLFLILESLPILSTIPIFRFFSDSSWHPTASLFNLTPMLWGSILVTAGSLLIAGPLGVLIAIFCLEFSPPWMSWILENLIETAAGIPSVVYGFWGLVVLVPWINNIQAPGTSLLAGILILSLMILPTMFLTAKATLINLPKYYLNAAEALGLSRFAIVFGIYLPAARMSLISGLILQAGRAIGETMALLMVCGNVVQMPKSLFDPIRTLTTNIALEMAYATGCHRSALFVSGLILMLFVTIFISVAQGIVHAQR